ncbi:hypothetical protein ADL05_10575 [Nocardiopsis sp. NRRL B-16309]|nr:hypothetical protein ADL05_10575 [Nocardiopsis sp. NRRL B-16309]
MRSRKRAALGEWRERELFPMWLAGYEDEHQSRREECGRDIPDLFGQGSMRPAMAAVRLIHG